MQRNQEGLERGECGEERDTEKETVRERGCIVRLR